RRRPDLWGPDHRSGAGAPRGRGVMTGYYVHRHAHGARLELDDLVVDADGIHLARSQVRVVLRVARAHRPLYTDTVTLSSGRARARALTALATAGAGTVTEGMLLALEAACRQPAPVVPDAPKNVPAGGGQAGGTVVNFRELARKFGHWLLISDPALLPVFTGALLAHRLGTEPVWLLLVAPPGATKTEPLRALYGYPGVYPLS